MQISVIPERELKYYPESNFGIIACSTDSKEVKLNNKYNNIILKGNMPKLNLRSKYIAEVNEVYDTQNRLGYEVQYIHEAIPTSIDDEKQYLSAILTDLQVYEIFKTYPKQSIISLVQNDQFDYNKVKGIGLRTYEIIKDKILNNLPFQIALVELSKYGMKYNIIKNLYDQYERMDILLERIKINPYILADEVSGISFAKCDIYARNMGIDKYSPYRINACIKYLLKEQANSNGHSWINKKNILNDLVNLLDIDKKIIINHLNNKNEELSKDIYSDDIRIALMQNFYYEKYISDKLIELISLENNFFVDDMEDSIIKVENEQGFLFTDEQKDTIKLAIIKNVLVINGGAGVGKTTILKGILSVLEYYSYATCALSGKASQRIVESTGFESQTIHRLLGYTRNNTWTYNKNLKLPYDIVILDETSMVDNGLFYRLISAIEKGSKLILLGDIEQLEPIGAGFILKDLINSEIIPTITLTKIHRQAEMSGILSIANKVRKGWQVINEGDYNNKIFGELKDLYFYPFSNSESVYNKVINICKTYKGDILDFQVIVPLKKRGILSANNLNKVLQDIFNSEMIGDEQRIINDDIEIRLNDKVIQCGNNYKKNVFNGTQGIVEDIDFYNNELSINFIGSSELVKYSFKELKQIDLSYALTVHRDQGSEQKNIIFAMDYSAYTLLSKQLVYTAITRAQKCGIICCELEAFRFAVSQNKASKRNTFLAEFLEEYNDNNILEEAHCN